VDVDNSKIDGECGRGVGKGGGGGGGGVIRCFKAKVVPIKVVNVVRGLKKQ